MKNIILFVLINFVSIGFINSQSREKQFIDNFAINNGVTVNVAAPAIVLPAKTDDGKSINQKNNQPAVKKLISKTVSSNSKTLTGFSTGDASIDSYILEYSALHNVDPLLIYAQMHQESGFKRRATSYKGASGLMQLMPGTATRFGVSNIYDPKQNINAGIKYMRWLMDKFNGDVNLALAGYNAGEGAVMKYGNNIPPYRETQAYVKRISAHYASIKKSAVETKSSKPVQQVAQTQPQPVSAPKFEQRASTIQLSNGKTIFSNF